MSETELPLKIPKGTTQIDRIIEFKKSSDLMISLSDQDQSIMDRADYADNLIRTDLHNNNREIATRISEEYSVSMTTAYKDIENAIRIHGSVKRYSKDYWISFVLEHARKALGMAFKTNNVGNVIKAIHELSNIIALMPEESTDPRTNRHKHNYYLVVKNESGALQINLNNVEKITADQIKKIEETFDQGALSEQFEILNEQLGA